MSQNFLYLNIFKKSSLAKSGSPNFVCVGVYLFVAFCHFHHSVLPKKNPYISPLVCLMSSPDVSKANGKTDVLWRHNVCTIRIFAVGQINSLQKLTLEKQGMPIVFPHGGAHSNKGPTATGRPMKASTLYKMTGKNLRSEGHYWLCRAHNVPWELDWQLAESSFCPELKIIYFNGNMLLKLNSKK